jgi:hypothetical protein
MKTATRLSAFAALAFGLAASALAGPTMTFGPDNKGELQLDYKGQFQMVVRDIGSGPQGDKATTDFNFRRNRLALMGAYGDIFSLYVQTEFVDQSSQNPLGINTSPSDPRFTVLDAVLRFDFGDAFKVNLGKFKYGFSRENLEACEQPLTLDRSLFLTAPLLGSNPTRDMGASVWGNLLGEKLQYRLDIMEGRQAATGDATHAASPRSSFRYTGRLHVSLLDPESGYGYRGTYMGQKKVLTLGVAVQGEPDAVYSDWRAKTGEKDYSAWTVDAFYEQPFKDVGTVTLSGAYVKYKLGHAYLGANPEPMSYGIQGEKNGWYAKAGYMLPGMPLQFFGRHEQWKFAQLNGIYNQKLNWTGIGANYYIWGQDLKLTVEYSATRFDKQATVDGVRTKDLKTFIAQVQLIF